MININSEKSINNHLSLTKSNSVTILGIEQYDDYCGILFIDPVDDPEGTTHFKCLKKNKLFSNMYYEIGSANQQNQSGVNCYKAYEDGDETAVFFIYGLGNDFDKCTSFELTINSVNKLEEISVSNTPYILIRTYDLEDQQNNIIVLDGSLSEKEFNQMLESME